MIGRWLIPTLALAATLALPGCSQQAAPAPADQPVKAPSGHYRQVGEKLVTAINADDQQGIQALFAPAMRQALPEAKSSAFFRGIVRDAGKVLTVGPPRLSGDDAHLRLTFERVVADMKLTLDRQDKIIGLLIVPATLDTPVPARNATPLRLPFTGEWLVFWGGAGEAQNRHAGERNQRRALDLIQEDAQGSSHRGDGARSEDYYCYGQDVLAAGAGTVVMVIDGVPDNAPGSMNIYSALGNGVMIRHAEHEFSVYAHLQPHTIQVKVGDTVKPGQALGLCGNSGNSSQPHLHFHLQNTQVLQDGTGFAPYFQNVRVTRGGRTTVEKDYTPVKGDRIRQE